MLYDGKIVIEHVYIVLVVSAKLKYDMVCDNMKYKKKVI